MQRERERIMTQVGSAMSHALRARPTYARANVGRPRGYAYRDHARRRAARAAHARRPQRVPNMGHYVFLISIRRLTQYNLGSPTGLAGLPALRAGRSAGARDAPRRRAWTERKGWGGS